MRLVVELSYHQEIDEETLKEIKQIPLSELNKRLDDYKKDLEVILKDRFSAEGLKIDANLVND